MDLTSPRPPWLLLVFSLPAKRASQRVQIWRKLQRYGMLALPGSAYVLPNTSTNQERLEWLARTIRSYKGQASVVQVHSFDYLSSQQLQQLFTDARSRDYERLQGELKKFLALSQSRRPAGKLNRLRRRFQDIVAIDFFGSSLRSRVENLLLRADEPSDATPARKRANNSDKYAGRLWLTRPRPGIDRVSSAWLIRRFIDPKARFAFGNDPQGHSGAIPFDMFVAEGFGHRGEDCTFETLCREFRIRDRKVRRIAEIIHDADLGDEKFGRSEGQGLDQVLNGWAQPDITDEELLLRGMELIEGLYRGLS
jgi:hypothetical protein